jgi:mRNA interferase RelE/StbE
MPVRVELIDEAIVDLADHAEGGMLRQFFKKLLEIEENGANVGEPLGKELVGWRKLTVGNRNWRTVFRVDRAGEVATVCVIGDREDAACYEEAQRRAKRAESADAASLAESMMDLFGTRKERKAARRKHKAGARG